MTTSRRKSSKPKVARKKSGKRTTTISSRMMFQGKVFGVRRDEVIEPGGVRAVRDVVTHGGSVVLLPVFPDGRILLVRQYRHTAGKALWELSAGRREPGETFLIAAQRELREETGFRAGRFRKLLSMFPSPGFVAEKMIIYAAGDLRPDPAAPDADERITTRRFTLPQLLRWIRDGRIIDAKSLAGILYYARFAS
jgi:ADP-ribose pyrophosphatase